MDAARDHVLGILGAEVTVVEYGSYACPFCHAAHEIIARLRDRLGDRMRYVFRHLPIAGSTDAERAAELAEYAAAKTGQFWAVHDALMKRGPTFSPNDFEQIAAEFNLPPLDEASAAACRTARRRVREDVASARRSGALATRPVWWALALGGAGGVNGLMDYFQRELVDAMLHLGVDKIATLGREHVQRIGA